MILSERHLHILSNHGNGIRLQRWPSKADERLCHVEEQSIQLDQDRGNRVKDQEHQWWR